jgi:hypothetical protein
VVMMSTFRDGESSSSPHLSLSPREEEIAMVEGIKASHVGLINTDALQTL